MKNNCSKKKDEEPIEVYHNRAIVKVEKGYLIINNYELENPKKHHYESKEQVIYIRQHLFHYPVYDTKEGTKYAIDQRIEREEDPRAWREKEERRKEERERKSSSFVKDERVRKAILAGARVGEKSLSKIHWDAVHGKIEIVQGKLNYEIHWILDCVADQIAQEKWFGVMLFDEPSEPEKPKVLEE